MRLSVPALLAGVLVLGSSWAHAAPGQDARSGHAPGEHIERGGRPDRGERPGRSDREDHGDRPARRFDGPVTLPAGVVVPTWSQLGPERQRQLASLETQWDTLPASRRVRALERLERHARWEAMTPEQREKLRAGARNFRDMPPELREKMRTSMETMRALPEPERQALFDLWRSLDPAQRRVWLEAGGPGISPPPKVPPAR